MRKRCSDQICDTNIKDDGVFPRVNKTITVLFSVIEVFCGAVVEGAVSLLVLVPGARHEPVGVVCRWDRVGDPLGAEDLALAGFSTFGDLTSVDGGVIEEWFYDHLKLVQSQ